MSPLTANQRRKQRRQRGRQAEIQTYHTTPTSCDCDDWLVFSRTQPDYRCQHMLALLEMQNSGRPPGPSMPWKGD